MSKGKSKERPPLTDFEVEAARKLKARWLKIPKDERPTQDKMGELWGEGGSQSLISQYLNGIIPLNLASAIRFAGIFDCEPHEILDVPELQGRGPLSDNVVQIKKSWPFQDIDQQAFERLPLDEQREVAGIIKEKIRQAYKAKHQEKQIARVIDFELYRAKLAWRRFTFLREKNSSSITET